MCPSTVGYPEYYTEQANALNNYGKPLVSPFSETYNPNWQNHPNLSWRQNYSPTNIGGQQVHQQSQFRPPTQAYPFIPQSTPQFVAPPRQQPSLKESLKTFMQSTSQAIQEIKSSTHLNTQAISKLENQYAINGSSSSTHGQEHVQSITILRSGKQVDNQVKMLEVEDDENIVLEEKGVHNSQDDHKEKKGNSTSIPIQDLSSPLDRRFVPKAPFPQSLINPQKSAQFGDILEVFKQVQINIPFLDVIQQVLAYAKFLKDLVTMKRKTNVPKKAFLTEQLGLGELKPTTMTLQLADRSVKIPRGIIENVLIKVDAFYFPIDFVVLDTEPALNASTQVHVILGCPFLTTSNALINCRSGVMKISFGNMTVELNIFDINKQVLDNKDICEVNMIGSLVHGTFLQSSCEDPLKACLTCVDCKLDTKKSIEEVNALLDFVPLLSIDSWQPTVVPFPLSSSSFLSIVEPPKLDDFWEHQLISILQEHKVAIGWKIDDIKGISASMVMQRIHLDDIAKASQHVFDPGLDGPVYQD
ncbi:uncharacterized protein LOC112032110 [Quercus suber]|uniref:uncharacterized protein LOC112032110 n=1 Tax=Quercus suber TaxID=58331 RepID=UPI000CE24B67|nr:uncharacterized protein LOC112032110 [Quercus suber]